MLGWIVHCTLNCTDVFQVERIKGEAEFFGLTISGTGNLLWNHLPWEQWSGGKKRDKMEEGGRGIKGKGRARGKKRKGLCSFRKITPLNFRGNYHRLNSMRVADIAKRRWKFKKRGDLVEISREGRFQNFFQFLFQLFLLIELARMIIEMFLAKFSAKWAEEDLAEWRNFRNFFEFVTDFFNVRDQS